jgi:hypothetical protein
MVLSPKYTTGKEMQDKCKLNKNLEKNGESK